MKKSEPFHIYFNLKLFIVHTMFIECNEVKCIHNFIFLEIILQIFVIQIVVLKYLSLIIKQIPHHMIHLLLIEERHDVCLLI